MKRFFATILLLLSLDAAAQVVVSGAVSGQNGAMEGINVMLQTRSGSVVGFAFSDSKGEYSVKYSGTADSLKLIATSPTITTYAAMIKAVSAIHNIKVIEGVIDIKEVRIEAAAIRRLGDTLSYNVAAFVDASDRNIGQVIAKMPGLQVDKGGKISYNGKAINKFYIEDMDMLGSGYGVATNNISSSDIASVQVLENHQPIRSLKGAQQSEAAAINIKLKADVKGTFNLTALLGIGYGPLQWNAELATIYFGRKFQTLNVYKSNNAGIDVADEMGAYISTVGSMLGVREPTTPPTDKERYYQNNTQSVSLNSLNKLSDKYTLSVNATYFHDEPQNAGSSATTYNLPDGKVVKVDEITQTFALRDKINVGLNLEGNQKGYYLSDKLIVTGDFRRNHGHAITNGDSIGQLFAGRNFNVANNFTYNKSLGLGESYVYINSYNGYSEGPSQLDVRPMAFADFNIDKGVVQSLTLGKFSSRTSVTVSHKLGLFRVGGHAKISAEAGRLVSNLDVIGATHTPDSLTNDSHWSKVDIVAAPEVSYWSKNSKFYMSFSLPVTYNNVKGGSTINRIFAGAALGGRWDIAGDLKLNFNGSYNSYTASPMQRYDGYIMTSYRTIGSHGGQIAITAVQNYSLKLAYANALNAIFANFEASYSSRTSDMLYGTYQVGATTQTKTFHLANTNSGYNFKLSVGKRIIPIKTTVSAWTQVGGSTYDVLQQERLRVVASTAVSAGAKLNIAFGRVAKFDYNFSWSQSNSRIAGGEKFAPIDIIEQQGLLMFYIGSMCQLSVSGQHFYNNSISSTARNLFFADAAFSVVTPRVEYILQGRNLLNTRAFSSAFYDSSTSYIYTYAMRPLSVMFSVRFAIK